jgi:glycine dehydrogenase subunit 2
VVVREDGRYRRVWDRKRSIGKLHGCFGNFGVMARAYTYIAKLGREGIKETAQGAVLNANYLAARIEHKYPMPYGRGMHECVATGTPFKPFGIKTLDIAKRLLEFGFHAPTVYFPLIVPEALMIEPTETETKEDLDRFADALLQIAEEAEKTPEVLTGAPRTTPVSRFDEAAAARSPNVRWKRQ